MKDLIVIAFLIIVISASAFYVLRAKKKGQKCIGCPNSCSCSKECHKNNQYK